MNTHNDSVLSILWKLENAMVLPATTPSSLYAAGCLNRLPPGADVIIDPSDGNIMYSPCVVRRTEDLFFIGASGMHQAR